MNLRADHSNLLHEELLSNTKADKQWVSWYEELDKDLA